MNSEDPRRLLLLSTSTIYGGSYLEYAVAEIRSFFGGISRILFVPFALSDQDGYARRVADNLLQLGFSVDSIHAVADKSRAVADAEGIFVGGGNTFRLLKALYDLGLLSAIRERVAEGMPYMGSSAGSNVAGPTIRTTNDMPIVQPPSFDALDLVRFQINPHYVDADAASIHMGETREERIRQFHEENETPVLGLREGGMMRVERGIAVLQGAAGARLFRRGVKPMEVTSGSTVEGFI